MPKGDPDLSFLSKHVKYGSIETIIAIKKNNITAMMNSNEKSNSSAIKIKARNVKKTIYVLFNFLLQSFTIINYNKNYTCMQGK